MRRSRWPIGCGRRVLDRLPWARTSQTLPTAPGLLTFPANVTSANIVINITQDQIDEERERFRVVLVPLTDGTITEGKESRVVLIKDEHQENDPYRPTASLQLVSSGPVPENEGPVEFAIVLDRIWGREGRYEVELLPRPTRRPPRGSRAQGKEGDFEDSFASVILRIPAGQTRFEFSVPLYDDDVREEDETFLLQLTSPYDDSHQNDWRVQQGLGHHRRRRPYPAHRGGAVPFPQRQRPGIGARGLHPAGHYGHRVIPTDTLARRRFQRPLCARQTRWTWTPRCGSRFDPNSGATRAAGLDDFAPLEVEDDQGAFQEVESFDIVDPRRSDQR